MILKHKITGTYENKKRPGRPKLSTSRQDRKLVLSSLRDRWLTSPILKYMEK